MGAEADTRYAFVRRAQIDLHDRRKDDPKLLLVWIRNSFAESGVVLAGFDLALALTWEAARSEEHFPKLTKPWLGRTTDVARGVVEDTADIGKEWLRGDGLEEFLREALGEVPGVGFLLKRFGRWAIDKSKKLYVERTRDFLRELYRDGQIKEPYELSALLPWMLAQDVNLHLKSHPTERLILLIDEYERVFDEGGVGARWKENAFDSHVRSLIQHANGLLIVFFSRERLPWKDDSDWREDTADAHHLIGGLTQLAAHEFLLAIPIESTRLREAIIDSAKEDPHPRAHVYPLLLDLQVEHWRHIQARGETLDAEKFRIDVPSFEGRRRELVARLLRDYGPPMQATLERLSVARRFDREAFAHVVHTFGTALPLDSFTALSELTFVTKGEDGFLTLHRSIAQTISETLEAARRRESVEALLAHYVKRAKVEAQDVNETTVSVVIEAAALRQATGDEAYDKWLEVLLHPLEQAARYSIVTEMWREALDFVETLHPERHADIAGCLNHLGMALHSQGNHHEARQLLERAFAMYKDTLGPMHRDVAAVANNLASVLQDEGNPREAIGLYQAALAIWTNAIGPNHPDTATCLNNIATLLADAGDLAGARELFERALVIYEVTNDELAIASTLNNFAMALRRDDAATARAYCERALAICQLILGKDHPDAAATLNNLGSIARDCNDLPRARELHERALGIFEKNYGPRHPEVARTLNNLGGVYQAQRDFKASHVSYERALAISLEAMRPYESPTDIIVTNFVSLYDDEGDPAGGLALCERYLGSEHPQTATSLNNVGMQLLNNGDFINARPLFARALAILEKAYGPNDPATIALRHNLEATNSNARPIGERQTVKQMRFHAVAAAKKVGRNEPCWCGSGKAPGRSEAIAGTRLRF